MTSTDRLAEIERLRARVAELEGQISSLIAGAAALATRALATDTERAVSFGTLAQPTPDWPTKIEHNIPPSAPPHGEPLSVVEINWATARALEAINSPEPENDDE